MENATGEPLASWPAETPVLMSDWLVRPISGLQPGDTVVGLEPGHAASRSKLVSATVLEVRRAPALVVELTMETGNPVGCSTDAVWYTNRFPRLTDPTRKTYAKARAGSSLMQVDLVEDQPTARASLLWYWLAGMVDGEGHVADSSLPITQTTTKNGPVWAKLCDVLDELGIEFNVHQHAHLKEGWQPRADAVIRNVRDVYKRLLRYADPGKREQMIDALWRRCRRPIRAHDRVLAVGYPELATCWQLATSAGNQVVWGYVASNFALGTKCPRGHVLDARVDRLGRTYQTCATCGPSPAVQLANQSRRLKLESMRAIGPDDAAALARANQAITSGEAVALRKAANLTQVKLGALCDISQPRLSSWESGGVIPASPAGVRYARLLDELRDKVSAAVR